MSDIKPKHKRCTWSHPHIVSADRIAYQCFHDDPIKGITESNCENCPNFASRYIEYPITVNAILTEEPYENPIRKPGLCAIRPCGDEYQGKTFLGIYLGDMASTPTARYNIETKELTLGKMTNPAIFIPELNKVVWGYESWWHKIEKPEDLTQINNQDIDGQWYVALAKAMASNDKKGDENA